ncbi:hypothetical protein HK102_006095 [Quaeritorhiza haematococci]|nr:hypothetical protein HK102_006095 [Quaeritorhiza haematococci]
MPIQILRHLPDFISAPPQDGTSSAGNDHAQLVESGANGTSGNVLSHLQSNVTLVFYPPLSNGYVPGKGTLYVAESQLMWHDAATTTTVAVDYPSIVIHAISRSTEDSVINAPCIYCQLDTNVLVNEDGVEVASAQQPASSNGATTNGAGADEEMEEGDDEEEDVVFVEMRLIPEDVSTLDSIFQALSNCAALHPDKDADMEEDDDDGFMYSADNVEELSEVGQAALRHLETVFDMPARDTPFQARPIAISGASASQSPALVNGESTPPSGQSDWFADAEEAEK